MLVSAACSPLLSNLKLFIHSSGSSKLYVHIAASRDGELEEGTSVKFQVGKMDRPIAIIYVAFTSCRKKENRFLLQAFNMRWVSAKGTKPNLEDVNCISFLDTSPEEMETAEEVQTQRLCMSAMLLVLQVECEADVEPALPVDLEAPTWTICNHAGCAGPRVS